MKLKTFIHNHKTSPYIFSNSKTGGVKGQKAGVSVDFGICQFMSKNENDNYTSKVCQGCYAARLLNVYPQVKTKLENLPMNASLEDFENDIKRMKDECGLEYIRFYALGDFSPWHIPYIFAAAKHVTVNIISKSLAMKPYQVFLDKLNNQKNIWVSLSFNFDYSKRFEEIEAYCLETKSNNIHLNWTINYRNKEQREDERVKRVQTIHVTNKKKLDGAINFGLDKDRICGIFDVNGEETQKGSCHECNGCHVSYYQYHKKGKRAKLPVAA